MVSYNQVDVVGILTVFSEGKCLFSDKLDDGRTLGQTGVKYYDGLYVLIGRSRPSEHLSLLALKSCAKSGQGVDLWQKRWSRWERGHTNDVQRTCNRTGREYQS